MDIWTFLWNAFIIFAFVVYLMILITIFTDLFRDRSLAGGYKVLWFIALLVFPYLTAFIYLIARGRSMAERQHEFAKASNDAATAYIRQAAGSGPASEIASAKALLDDGTITADEYEALKKKALA